MSLRVRLNLLITLLFVFSMLAGSSYVIRNAQMAVNKEMANAAHISMQLIEAAIISGDDSKESEQRLLVQLAGLEITKHLKIAIRHDKNGELIQPEYNEPDLTPEAPSWFIDLVHTGNAEFRRTISRPGVPYTEIIVWSDPADEITRAWIDARDVLFFLLTNIVLANILIYITLGVALAPIDTILKGLEGIERGEYNLRLPKFNLPELNKISEKFNHMAGALMTSGTENRYLRQRSIAIQEAERRNLVRELHDELGQTLSAIKAIGSSISDKSRNENKSIFESANSILNYTDHMFNVTRNMMQRLRPAVLDELGIVVALQEMTDAWNEQHEDVFCYFETNLNAEHLDEEIAINIYRIVQESLTNVIRHAKASEVTIRLTQKTDSLTLIIIDNGIGFDQEKKHKGLGLLGIKERAEAMTATYRIDTGDNEGVTIIISIPLIRSSSLNA